MTFHESRTPPIVGETIKPDIIDDVKAWLPRGPAAAALKDSGYPISSETLATMASRGGGPQFFKWGSRVLYRRADLLEWAESRLSEPIRSTSELDSRPRTEPKSVLPVLDVRRARKCRGR